MDPNGTNVAQTNTPPAAPQASVPPAAPSAPLEPKRYIRTLASDMAVLKQGGVPDLAPLTQAAKPSPVVAPSLAAEDALPLAPPPSPAFRPSPGAESLRRRPENLNILAPQPVLPIEKPAPAPAPIAPPSPKPAPLQTYASDFTDRVRTTGASTATVIAAEQDARKGAVRPAPSSKKGSPLALILGVLLLAAGIGGASYAYLRYVQVTAPVLTTPVILSPIFVNDTQTVSGTGAELMRAMLQSIARPPSPGTVRELTLATSTSNVFLALQMPAPGILTRNISIAPSLAGIVNVGSGSSFFFILPAASYGDTFAGMLQWEATMLRDFDALYPPVALAEEPLATTTASTTSARAATTTKAAVLAPGFVDEVIQNHDVRVYRDQRGRPRLVYGYWNQRTLVIARDPAAFSEIVSRLANSRTR